MNILVGSSGFVGSNLALSRQFDMLCNSKNVKEAYGLSPDFLIYAGVSGTKFIANSNPENDCQNIENAIVNIKKINPKKLILISTVDVYSDMNGCNETTIIKPELLHPYGEHRYRLEQWVKDNMKDYHIIRLPAIYGENLKKNFIYDLINPIPPMLSKELITQIGNKSREIYEFYFLNSSGYYSHKHLNSQEQKKVIELLDSNGIKSINFTDSRATYQFYNLADLNNHIQIAVENHIRVLNLVTEPVQAAEVCKFIDNFTFQNELSPSPIKYNLCTIHDQTLGGANGYIMDKQTVLSNLMNFVRIHRKEIK